MQFLVWCTDKPGMFEKRMSVIEDHWAFYEQYTDHLIARGPTVNSDNLDELTGSVHIYDVEGPDVLQRCVYEDPFAKAGVFDTILIRRFALGVNGVQSDFEPAPNRLQFFVYAQSKADVAAEREKIRQMHERYCRDLDDRIISQGDIYSDDGDWAGNVYFLEVPSNSEVDMFLRDEPYNSAGLLESVQVRSWRIGGRRALSSDK